MARRILAMYLDGPLQSWGAQSRFDRRTSLSYPTRSGVVGLICAAMGIDRADSAGLRRLDDLHMTVYCFGGGARLLDYHTVGGGYDKACAPQNIVRTASGHVGHTVETHREYLQDARFGVLLRGDGELLGEVAAALTSPRWGIWLGRKCCIPATPVCHGLFDSEEAALERLCALEAARPPHRGGTEESRPRRRITEVSDFAKGTDTLMDRPVDFAKRQFTARRVAEQ